MGTTVALGLMCAVGVLIAVLGLSRPAPTTGEMVQERLQAYGGERPLTLDEIELQRPLSERVFRPMVERLANAMVSRTPDNTRQDLENQLILAGRPANLSASEFLAVRMALAVVGGVLGFIISLLLVSSHSAGAIYLVIWPVVGAIIGMYLPTLWLRQLVAGRKKEIQVALPDALDLLTICVEAGLSFDSALSRITEKFSNALADEFGQVLQEVRLGRARLDALDAMGRRCKVEDLHNFIQAVIQSEQMGVGIAKILRLQSEEIRRKRRQRAQELAARASLKMMFPMVGCIFPTLWIVLLGPSLLIIMNAKNG